jgi:hypothetical protein
MDLFHRLIDLIDKNAERIPDGDYVEMCNVIQELREKVKPPEFLLDQNEPMTLSDPGSPMTLSDPGSPIRMMTPHEVATFLEELHQDTSYTVDSSRRRTWPSVFE